MPSLEEKVKQIIAEQLDVELSEVIPSITLDDLGADSLDKIEITMALEEGFEIEIADSDVENIRTVQDVVDAVSSHVKVGSK
ncbi:MAG: acyl carrier protein [Terriglobales bacterium]